MNYDEFQQRVQNLEQFQVLDTESKSAKWAYRLAYMPFMGVPLYLIFSFVAMIKISKSKTVMTGLGKLKKGLIVFIVNLLFFLAPVMIYHSSWFNERYYPNFQRKWIGQYDVSGNPTGKWITWYSNGQKRDEGEYIHGRKNGKWISWYENGQKLFVEEYNNDLIHGKISKWDEKGQKEFIRETKNGQPHGVFQEFENGIKTSEKNYKNGYLDGKQIEWDLEGNKKYEHEYKNGLKHGKWIWWDIYEKIAQEYNNNGFFWTDIANKNGKIVENYQNDKLNGPSTHWENGQKTLEFELVNDEIVAKRNYYDNGKIKDFSEIKNGKAINIIIYWKNGQKQHEVKYNKYERVIMKKYYNLEGKEISENEWMKIEEDPESEGNNKLVE